MLCSAAMAQTAITRTTLNLREAPSANAPIRQVLEAGRTVYVWNVLYTPDYQADWSQVLIGNQVGWVKSEYLSSEKTVWVGNFDNSYFGSAARVKEAFKLKFNPSKDVALDTEWMVRVQKVDGAYFVRRHDPDVLPFEGDPLLFRQTPVADQSNPDNPQLTFSFPALTAGAYVVSLAKASAPNAVQVAIPVFISDLSVIAKNTPDQVHYWAFNLKTGQPVAGAKIQMYTLQNGQLVNLAEGQTNRQGALTLKAPRDQQINFLASDGTSESYTPVDNSTPAGEPYRALVVTDRPLYQQTDTVQVTGVVRRRSGPTYQPYTGAATFRVVDPNGNVVYSKDLKLDGRGAFREDLPMNFPTTGTHLAQVVITSDLPNREKPVEDISFVPFMVRPYVKPSFDLALSLPEEMVAGESTLKLQSTLFSGGGTTAQADVFAFQGYPEPFYWSYATSQKTLEVQYQDNPEYALYGGTSEPSDSESRVAQTAIKNGEGTVKLNLQARDNLPTPYNVTVRALDEFGRSVVSEKNVTVYPSSVVLSVVTPPENLKEKTPATVVFSARKVGGTQALVGQPIEARFTRSTWEWNNQTGEWKEKILQTFTTQTRTDASGKASVNFTPSGSGSIRVDLSTRDDKGRSGTLSSDVGWVPEETASIPPIQPLELEVPQQAFKVGATVPVTLKSKLPKDTLVWLTAEGRGVYNQQFVRITGEITKTSIKITPEMQPGFRIQAAYHTDQTPVIDALGAEVYVPFDNKNLQIKVVPEKNPLKPGESSRVRIETTQNGKPVSAWVTVGAVNEAIYNLIEDAVPDPYRYFWGLPFYTEVFTTSALPSGYPAEAGGGGGDMAGAFPRTQFRDTAFFQTVTTDQKGLALVNFTLPDDLTRYRVLARGVTEDTSAGEARATLRATLPFYVRISAPTYLTRGDETTVYTTVHNQSKEPVQATVNFKLPSGILKKTVNIEAQSMTVVPWIVKAPEAATLNLETTVTSGKETDSTTLMIPVREAGTDFQLMRMGEARGSALERINVPPSASEAQLNVFVSSSPLLGALRNMESLLQNDEKNALEAVLAAHYTIEARKDLGLDTVRAQALLRQNLQYLMGQQNMTNGGFAWAGGRSSPAYTLEALTAIGDALPEGLSYQEYNLRYAQGYLKETKTDSGSYGYQRMLYAQKQANTLSSFSPKTPQQAAELAFLFQNLSHYRTALKDQQKDSQGLSIDQDLIATSHALLAATLLKQPEAPELARWLASKLQSSTPRTLSQSALASHAIAQHLKDRGATTLTEPVTVNVNGRSQTLKNIPVLGTSVYFDGKPGQNTVQVSSNQPYAYTITTRYLTGTTTADTNDFALDRTYSLTSVKENGTTEVRLKLKINRTVKHLKLLDPIPAGFETLDPSAYQDVQDNQNTLWASKEHLDGATVIYLENLKPGEYTLSYKLRALSAGTYVSPAPGVQELDSGLKASGKTTILTVKP